MKFRELRNLAGLSLSEVGELGGIEVSHLCRFELGHAGLSPHTEKKLRRILLREIRRRRSVMDKALCDLGRSSSMEARTSG